MVLKLCKHARKLFQVLVVLTSLCTCCGTLRPLCRTHALGQGEDTAFEEQQLSHGHPRYRQLLFLYCAAPSSPLMPWRCLQLYLTNWVTWGRLRRLCTMVTLPGKVLRGHNLLVASCQFSSIFLFHWPNHMVLGEVVHIVGNVPKTAITPQFGWHVHQINLKLWLLCFFLS